MTQKSSRDIEFAIRLAIAALRREMEARKQPSPFAFDQGAPDITNGARENRPPDKRCRDVERAIAILKAIKTGYDGSEW